MVYDKLPIALLSALSTEEEGSTNALIARYVLEHVGELEDVSVKDLAAACHVGSASVSRFAKDVGYAGFAELRESFLNYSQSFERVDGKNTAGRIRALSSHATESFNCVGQSLDQGALIRLVDDLRAYRRIAAFGLLKAQAAALDLQVDLLMQGRYIQTSSSISEQFKHISEAKSDEMIIVFSYTASYFDAHDFARDLRRLDRPKIWVVCGCRKEMPPFVADVLSFDSELRQIDHPYQLQQVASIIAQEYAAG